MMKQGKRSDVLYQAQAILSRRDHSRAELQAKLRRRGFTAGQIAVAVARLQQRGLLDDEQFTAAFISAALRRTIVGPRWLRSKLREKGIASERITTALQQAFPPGREEALIRQAAAAWRRLHPRHASDQARLYRFLASRGFSPRSY